MLRISQRTHDLQAAGAEVADGAPGGRSDQQPGQKHNLDYRTRKILANRDFTVKSYRPTAFQRDPNRGAAPLRHLPES
jgi:hypothetical protein